METTKVEVTAKVVGASDPAYHLGPVWVTVTEEKISLEYLIERSVEAQIDELLASREVDLKTARRILDRQYMSQEEIHAQRERDGSVRFPSERTVETLEKEFNVVEETQRALDGFVEGRIIVFVDGVQVESLEEEIVITPTTKVKFIRMTPLVGG